MSDYPALTEDQRAALEAFGDNSVLPLAHGTAAWRQRLADLWLTGADATHKGGPALRQIRNTFGPTWLLDVYAWGWLPEAPAWQAYRHGEQQDGGGLLWSGTGEPPAVGARVNTFNGPGTVTGYFVEGPYLGVTVRTDAPKNGHPVGGYFGAEIRP